MADVGPFGNRNDPDESRGRGRNWGPGTNGNRGQLIIVAGIVLAVILVALALILNSAIFTENLATRSGDAGGGPTAFQADATGAVGDAIRATNDRAGTDQYAFVRDNYRGSVDALAAPMARESALQGRSLVLSRVAEAQGTRIVDTDASTGVQPNSPGSVANWVAADDARVRDFRMTVDRDSLPVLDITTVESDFATGTLSTAYYVEVEDDSGDQYRTALYRDNIDGDSTDEVIVHTYDDGLGDHVRCAIDEPLAQFDVAFSQGRVETVDGIRSCSALFVFDRTEIFDVSMVNGESSNIQAAWEMTVDVPQRGFRQRVNAANSGGSVCGIGGTDPTYAADDSGEPYTTNAVYAGIVDLSYRDGSTRYGTTHRIAPAERGPNEAPRFEYIKIEDTSTSSDASFDVEWALADEGGSSTVSVTAENVSAAPSVVVWSSSQGADTDSFIETNGNGHPYRFTFTVTDSDGNTRELTERHLADGDPTGCPP